jgi:CheY-like chemotaxis protein
MSKRVLVVDNETSIQTVAKLSLEMTAGWEVLTASSGIEAIDVALQEQPDAILLDVMMPDMDGPTTFARLQENPQTQAIPVILLTAKIQSSDQKYYASLGIQHTIGKPFDPLNLAPEIAKQLGWPI